MTTRKPAFRPSLSDQRRASLAAQEAMAHNGMSDAAKKHLAEFRASVPVKVVRTKRVRQPDDEPLEHAEQSAVISWWYWYAKAKQLDHRLLVAIPNGQALLKFADNPNAFIGYLKAEGMRVGMLDLVLFVARGKCHGMVIEMKRRTKGVVSDEQQEILMLLIEQSYMARVCYGADEAIAAIKDYMEGA